MSSRRVKVKPTLGYARGHAKVQYKQVNNKPPKDWNLGYELVCSFVYGLDEQVIAKIAGLRNYDTGITMRGPGTGVRDLMFPCGTNRLLAQTAARRLRAADHFGALRLRISYPVEHKGENSFTPWYDIDGKLIERIKHRILAPAPKILRARTSKYRKQPRHPRRAPTTKRNGVK
jgi:hypothetical protein